MPGLHGNALLFSPLLAELNSENVECVEFPNNILQSYESLFQWLLKNFDWKQPRILIAESFSGPLALQLAAKFPETIKGVVLAASFCASPTNPSLALLPIRPLMAIKPPKKALRHFLIGEEATLDEVKNLRSIVSNIPAKVLSQRIRAILSLEASDCPAIRHTPLLILQAQDDNMVPWESQNQLRLHYEHAKTHWLDSPHLILQHSPEECAMLIKNFTNSHLQELCTSLPSF